MSILKYKDPKTGEFKRINPYKADLSFVGKDGITINKAADSEKIEISGSELLQKPFSYEETAYNTDLYAVVQGGSSRSLYRLPVDHKETKKIRIVATSSEGTIRTIEPQLGVDCTNKKYVDDNYVKIPSPAPTNWSVLVYSPIDKKYTVYPLTIDATNATIPYRDYAKMNFKVGDLTADDDGQYCANKKYVDEADKDLRLKLTNLEQALNGYILDTTEEAYADLDSAVLKNSVAVGNNVYPIADKTRALVTRIEGKTTKMVQVLDKSTYYNTQTESGITATNNGDGSWTINGTATAGSFINFSPELSLDNGHKVLLTGNKTNSAFTLELLNQGIIDRGNGAIGNIKADFGKTFGIAWESGAVINNVTITPQLFDLTAMNREDITTVEQFKAEFPEFYPYENGNIYPAKISGVKFTGKNLFKYNWTRIEEGDVRNASIVKALENGAILQGNESNTSGTQSYANGWFTPGYISDKYKIYLRAGDRVTISANYEILESDNTLATIGVHLFSIIVNNQYTSLHSVKTKVLTQIVQTFTIKSNDSFHIIFTLNSNKVKITDIQVEISDSPTAYEPYTEPVSVTLPETYDLHGIGDYKDYLEITKNENNELYTLKKVQSVGVYEYTGNEAWAVGIDNLTSVFRYYCTDIEIQKSLGDKGTCNKYATLTGTEDKEGVLFGESNSLIYLFLNKTNFPDINSVKSYLSAQYAENNPVVIYYRLSSPVETVIATNLTYEQVTEIRHNGGLIEVAGNTNKGYARPTVTNTIVYRLTAANTAEG